MGQKIVMEASFQIFLDPARRAGGHRRCSPERINTAPAILLLLAGTALAFVPGMPRLELPPDLVLLLVLPPLIYSASVAMSWREFRFNLRVDRAAGGRLRDLHRLHWSRPRRIT